MSASNWRTNVPNSRPGYRQAYNNYRARGSRSSFDARRDNCVQDNVNKNSAGASNTTKTTKETPCPFQGWKLYFPNEDYIDDGPYVPKLNAMHKFFKIKLVSFHKDVDLKNSININCKDLITDPSLMEVYTDISTELRDNPEQLINLLSLSAYQSLYELEEHYLNTAAHAGKSFSIVEKPIKIIIRLTHFEPVMTLRNLKANYYGKFVSIRGTVVRAGNIKPLCVQMAFECHSCTTVQCITLPDGKFRLPTKCVDIECRGRIFKPMRDSPMTETVDWQTVRVQEMMADDQDENGRIPRTIECELTNDLVDSCVPGDQVTISGVVKVMSSSDDGSRSKVNKDKCMFLLYISSNSVTCEKNCRKTSDSMLTSPGTDFTLRDLYAIQEIQAQSDLFKLMVGSLCPSIYGHEIVKAGLLLGLFGGTSSEQGHIKNYVPVRADPHVLVVGDPGLGKSQMLQAVSHIAPRGVYVCGNTTTTSGLTVTLTKDGSSEYALEAGALVLSDQGCCCIDEFDKMTSQHQALLEAMEQQCISIAKAGIVCSLPARTSILAAANPAGGHYNNGKTVSENLKINGALLSRFDLVFILLDKPDEELDSLLSEHVMALHGGKSSCAIPQTHARRNISNPDAVTLKDLFDSAKPLAKRLKFSSDEQCDVIPAQLLRKYVSYGRKYVHPKLSPEAAQVLQTFYLELRLQRHGTSNTPVTTRQMESLIRLAEARARLELRELVTEQDAKDVVDIMKFSMIDTYSDNLGFMDFTRSQHGSGMSNQSAAKKFISVLSRIAQKTYNNLFTVSQLKEIAKDSGIQVPDFGGFICALNNQNYLLKKGSRVYQLQTVDI